MTSRGFTLPEVLLALLLSALVLTGASRAFPALQGSTLGIASRLTATQELNQLAAALGKSLQRAGYCAGECQGAGLTISPDAACLYVVWDDNHNGRWEAAEFRGYRLRAGNIEVHPGAGSCATPGGWERISDPANLVIERWQVARRLRHGWPPQVVQQWVAFAVVNGQRHGAPLHLSQAVTGFNL